MTADELRVYTVECIEHIRFGEDLDDAEFISVCRAIGAMPDEVLLHIIESDAGPEEIARQLHPGSPEPG
jgi:hypothetical protein